MASSTHNVPGDVDDRQILDILLELCNDDTTSDIIFNKYHSLTYLSVICSSPDKIKNLITQQQGNNVVNLSTYKLTNEDYKLLSKGLTFCPTPSKPNNSEPIEGLERFFRKLRLTFHFQDLKGTPTPDHLKKLNIKSDWCPTTDSDPAIESFCKTVRKEVLKEIHFSKKRKRVHGNLNSKSMDTIIRLARDPNIVIKKADKGSSICIMNTVDYLHECERQLADKNFYLLCEQDLTETHCKQVNSMVLTLYNHGSINTKVKKYLWAQKCSPGRFYILPKIHKFKLAGRPIVSANNAPTERLSEFCDAILNKYTPLSKSYVRDTTDFMNKMGKITIEPGDYIVTADVVSLYTNIRHEIGLRCMAKRLRDLSKVTKLPVSIQDILQMLRIILYCNNFTFNNRHYLQISGVSMGTKVAPTYANLVLSVIEDEFLSSCVKLPRCFYRFLDDVAMVWPHSAPDLDAFINSFNSLYESIQLTSEISPEKVTFLDTWVILKPPYIHFDLYRKPTDSANYLMMDSCHPQGCKKGFFSQLLRLRRNCTKTTDFLLHAKQLMNAYITRGYDESSLKSDIDRVSLIHRDSLLQRKHTINTSTTTENTPRKQICVLPYNPHNADAARILKKFWPILTSSNTTAKLFPQPPIIGYRRPPNLKDKLTRASITFPIPEKSGNYTEYQEICTKTNCGQCKKLNMRKHFSSSVTGKKFRKNHDSLNCLSRNLVYLITCTSCRKQYIGETKQSITRRLYQHAYSVKKKMQTPIARHYNNNSCKFESAIIECIERIPGNPDDDKATSCYRLKRELHWIVELCTLYPYGINIKLGRPYSSTR